MTMHGNRLFSFGGLTSPLDLHRTLVPLPLLNRPLRSVFHSTQQVVKHLEERTSDHQPITPEVFRDLLIEVVSRASLRPSDLHHGGLLCK